MHILFYLETTIIVKARSKSVGFVYYCKYDNLADENINKI